MARIQGKGTHAQPTMNMAKSPNFCTLGICRPITRGMGTMIRAKSVAMLVAAVAMYKPLRLTQ